MLTPSSNFSAEYSAVNVNCVASVEIDARALCTLSSSVTDNVVRVLVVCEVLVVEVAVVEVLGGGSSGGSQKAVLSHTGAASMLVSLTEPAYEDRSHKSSSSSYQNDLH